MVHVTMKEVVAPTYRMFARIFLYLVFLRSSFIAEAGRRLIQDDGGRYSKCEKPRTPQQSLLERIAPVGPVSKKRKTPSNGKDRCYGELTKYLIASNW